MSVKIRLLFLYFILAALCGSSLAASNIENLKKEAMEGNPTAQYNFGLTYDKGDGVRQDFYEAAKWYSQAAEQGYASAQNALGSLYQSGQGVEQDYAKAVYSDICKLGSFLDNE